MQCLNKFLIISPHDRVLIVKAGFTVAAIRVALWVVPFRSLRRLLPDMDQGAIEVQKTDSDSIDKTVWAVVAASRYVPRATCLTLAVAAQVMLARQGCPTRLFIGVAKNQAGRLEAHAWLESQGGIVIGDLRDLSRYTPLPSLDGERS